MSITKNKKFYNFVAVPIAILLAATLRMFIVEVFVLPYDFASGGSTGVGAMIQYKYPNFSAGWGILIFNAPLLVLAFIYLSRDFAIKTGAAIVLSSVGMFLLGKYINIPRLVDEPILAAFAAGALGGVTLNIMLAIGGSTGGSDIIGMFIQKRFRATNVAWFITVIDATIVLISYFVYQNGLTPVLLSFTEMIVLALTSDAISSGLKSALKFEIITHNPDEISDEIINKLGRGVTKVPVVGMYSKRESSMLVCIIRKRQLADFNKILKKYPETFAYVSSASEVIGKGFKPLEEDNELGGKKQKSKAPAHSQEDIQKSE